MNFVSSAEGGLAGLCGSRSRTMQELFFQMTGAASAVLAVFMGRSEEVEDKYLQLVVEQMCLLKWTSLSTRLVV